MKIRSDRVILFHDVPLFDPIFRKKCDQFAAKYNIVVGDIPLYDVVLDYFFEFGYVPIPIVNDHEPEPSETYQHSWKNDSFKTEFDSFVSKVSGGFPSDAFAAMLDKHVDDIRSLYEVSINL